jgi:hypothetical protein
VRKRKKEEEGKEEGKEQEEEEATAAEATSIVNSPAEAVARLVHDPACRLCTQTSRSLLGMKLGVKVIQKSSDRIDNQ